MAVLVKYVATQPPVWINRQITNIIEYLDKINPDDINHKANSVYPQGNEIGQVKILCEIVRENYVCVDPLDGVVPKFEDREMKCEEIIEIILLRYENGKHGGP